MSNFPDLTPRKAAERQRRDERLAQALRDNLKRRKEQARAQEQPRAQGAAADDASQHSASSRGSSLSGPSLSSKSIDHGRTTAD